jgi:hypothetical protein
METVRLAGEAAKWDSDLAALKALLRTLPDDGPIGLARAIEGHLGSGEFASLGTPKPNS